MMQMRRKERAVTAPEEIDAIIRDADCIRLAFADGPCPYIVPVNFGYERADGVQRFYIHSAMEGRKVDLIRKLGQAGFELDCRGKLAPAEKACGFTYYFGSVIGTGRVAELTDPAEKVHAMQVLMGHYSDRTDWELPEAMMAKTAMFCLTVEDLSAKRHA